MVRPLSLDWLNGAAYQYLDQLSHEQHAFEYLRRNDDYVNAFRRVTSKADVSRTDAAERMAEPWGLRFRGRPEPARRPRRRRLAAATQPAPYAADERSAGAR